MTDRTSFTNVPIGDHLNDPDGERAPSADSDPALRAMNYGPSYSDLFISRQNSNAQSYHKNNTRTPPRKVVALAIAPGPYTLHWHTVAHAMIYQHIGVVHGVTNHPQGTTNEQGSDLVLPDAIQRAESFTSYTLPYSHMKGFDGYANTTVGLNEGTNPWMTAGVTSNPLETVSFKDSTTLLIAFAIMRTTDDFIKNRTGWEDSQPSATECVIQYCVNAYKTSSNDAYAAQTNHTLDPGTQDVYRTDLQLRVSEDPALGITTNMAGGFNISQAAVLSKIHFLLTWATPESISSVNNVIAYPDTNGIYTPNMPTVIEALWTSPNLSKTFDDVARSMTLDIREYSSVPKYGTLQQWVIQIKVEWSFITLPVIAVLGGCLYLFLTLMETRHLRLPVWKESAIATLAYGLPEDSQALLRDASAAGEIHAVSKHMMLSFQDDGHGLRLNAV
ncbi:hypothetical protein NA57DRAFT_56491 [Rhizodiscina lignyota]|uniref:Uncharacterized protein n=1 Tax=Rhizodiscina lignyota TaxID=1504668 RepID=A0A9P4IF43_9PEZI|nr:hypothetical protein NA57DRAFT_56491 [Rhizodiscina lignyota]